MADQTQEAIDARYAVTESLKKLIYGHHYGYLTAEVQAALVKALEAVEESEDTPTEDLGPYSLTVDGWDTVTHAAWDEVTTACGVPNPRPLKPANGQTPTCEHCREVLGEGALQESEHAICSRCQRDRPRAALTERSTGELVCKPNGPDYDDCMRIYNTV
jgi:hypothetical protein